MYVSKGRDIFDMAIREYGFNKVVCVVAGAIAGALIGFIICVNLIKNNPKKVEEYEYEKENEYS